MPRPSYIYHSNFSVPRPFFINMKWLGILVDRVLRRIDVFLSVVQKSTIVVEDNSFIVMKCIISWPMFSLSFKVDQDAIFNSLGLYLITLHDPKKDAPWPNGSTSRTFCPYLSSFSPSLYLSIGWDLGPCFFFSNHLSLSLSLGLLSHSLWPLPVYTEEQPIMSLGSWNRTTNKSSFADNGWSKEFLISRS